MAKRFRFTSEEKKVLGYVLAGAVANGVIDPILGNWTYNNPTVPKSPLEPYITTGDGIQLAMNAGVFLAGVLTDKAPLVWIGAGMLGEKIGMKTTLWIWNYLHPGRPAWPMPSAPYTPSNNVSRGSYQNSGSGSKYTIVA